MRDEPIPGLTGGRSGSGAGHRLPPSGGRSHRLHQGRSFIAMVSSPVFRIRIRVDPH